MISIYVHRLTSQHPLKTLNGKPHRYSVTFGNIEELYKFS
jgi:hypothetical protein